MPPTDGTTLSAIAGVPWAKTDRDNQKSLNLEQHLTDSHRTAERVLSEFIPTSVLNLLADAVGGKDSALALATFLAGVHDVGKCSPAFQSQGFPHLVSACCDAGLDIDPRTRLQARTLHHSVAGQIALERWLTSRSWDLDIARQYALPVGGHHGKFPGLIRLKAGQKNRSLLGDGLWAEVRVHIIEQIAQTTNASRFLDTWARTPLPATAQVLLTGIVIVSDWIASNTDLFPLDLTPLDRERRAEEAWHTLNLPTPWQTVDDDVPLDQRLRDRFHLPSEVSARPVQVEALALVDQTDQPGLFIIEAGMGEGKTEAALLLAERLASRLNLGGLLFALPSMATSDAMFNRVNTWLSSLPTPTGQPHTVALAHSKAHLNDSYRGIAEDACYSPDCDSTSVVVRHQWFNGRKKSALANFVIGTIDQVLMLGLASKHLMLRHLGIAGKVVVIDEVHAADAYMSVFLDRSLEWLGAYGTPVILLSATLPKARRQAMVDAYNRGRGNLNAVVHTDQSDGYPVLTASTSAGSIARVAPASTRESSVKVEPLDDDDQALVETLADRLRDGGCAVVIRNTVTRAQATFASLRQHFGDDVTLLHSRFISTDRIAREADIVRRFGPPTVSTERPYRHIVVATQVVEQSLDVDFDLMISDVAPIDLVLQRMGRLHRHERARRPDPVSTPTLLLSGIENWSAAVPKPVRGSVAVYGADALLCALAVLDLPTRTQINLPADISPLVQTAYSDDCPQPPGWADSMEDARRQALERLASRQDSADHHAISPPGVGDVLEWTSQVAGDLGDEKFERRGRAAVRDGQETIEVIVVQRNGFGEVCLWGSDGLRPIPIDGAPEPDLARRIAASTLRLPPLLTTAQHVERTLGCLEANWYQGWQQSRWLRDQLVLELDADGRAQINQFSLKYEPETGLVFTVQEDANA